MTYHSTDMAMSPAIGLVLPLAAPAERPRRAGLRHLPARACVQRQGGAAHGASEIVSGTALVSRFSPKWGEAVIDIAGPGGLVGGQTEGAADCSIIAATDLLLMPLDGADGDGLRRRLGEELERQRERRMMLAQASALERVAFLLLTLAGPLCRRGQCHGRCALLGREIAIPISRKDIASLLSLTIETVSRCFGKLREDRIIAGRQASLAIVLDPARLQQLGGDGAPCCAAAAGMVP